MLVFTISSTGPVVPKRVPLVSRENFNSWEKICFREELRGKGMDDKNLSFYYLFIQHIKTAQRGWFRWQVYSLQGQAALTAVPDVVSVCLVHNRVFFHHSR